MTRADHAGAGAGEMPAGQLENQAWEQEGVREPALLALAFSFSCTRSLTHTGGFLI